MNGAADRAWARAAAILSRSFLGTRVDGLLRCRSLGELAALCLPDWRADLPDRLLVAGIQAGFAARVLADVRRVAGDGASRLQAVGMGSHEYRWLKSALAARSRDAALPSPPDLGGRGRLHARRWPDLAAMTRHGPWSWLGDLAPDAQAALTGLRLDRQYWAEILSALADLAPDDPLARLLRRELALRNAAWSLRLRFAFGMAPAGIGEWLIGRGPEFRAAALEAAALPADNPAAWADWRFAAFLPPAGSGLSWRPDPLVFERRILAWVQRSFQALFHARPLDHAAIFAFCRLKDCELETVSSVAEGLLLGMDGERMGTLLSGSGGAA
jgi:hypothetical protein